MNDFSPTVTQPVPLLLYCPECSERHIDEGEFATKYHHTHACQHCGHVWRPAVCYTVGVQFLPGFKNDEESVSKHDSVSTEMLKEIYESHHRVWIHTAMNRGESPCQCKWCTHYLNLVIWGDK